MVERIDVSVDQSGRVQKEVKQPGPDPEVCKNSIFNFQTQ